MATAQAIVVGAALISATIFFMRNASEPAVAKPPEEIQSQPSVGLYYLVPIGEGVALRINTATGEICAASLNAQPLKGKGAVLIRCGYAKAKS